MLTCKVALAGRTLTQAWQPNAPAGVTNFAQITIPAHIVTVQVVDAPNTTSVSTRSGRSRVMQPARE